MPKVLDTKPFKELLEMELCLPLFSVDKDGRISCKMHEFPVKAAFPATPQNVFSLADSLVERLNDVCSGATTRAMATFKNHNPGFDTSQLQ